MDIPYLLRVDAELMDRTRVFLNVDYSGSEYSEPDLISPTRLPDKLKKLRYTMTGGKIRKLGKYDFYPASSSVPLVSARMRDCIAKICSSKEVFFFKATITSKYGEELTAWNVVPLIVRPCVDLARSEVKWWAVEDVIPGEFVSIRFLSNCMGNYDIVRAERPSTFILVSSRLKKEMEDLNPYGMKFFCDKNYRPRL